MLVNDYLAITDFQLQQKQQKWRQLALVESYLGNCRGRVSTEPGGACARPSEYLRCTYLFLTRDFPTFLHCRELAVVVENSIKRSFWDIMEGQVGLVFLPLAPYFLVERLQDELKHEDSTERGKSVNTSRHIRGRKYQ